MSNRRAKKVLLIGWDAADWQIIDPMLARGELPVLKQFLENGTRSAISTLFPIISPILWNSIATGKRADKHDILGFMEPNGAGFVRPVSSTSRKAKAIWNILSQHGLKSNVVGWFASYPAEKINGCIVTDRFRQGPGQAAESLPLDDRSVHPIELLDDLKDMVIKMDEIDAEQAEYFIPEIRKLAADDKLIEALTLLLAQCATIHNTATAIMESEPWDFMAVYYDTIDHFGHAFMEYRAPRMDHVSEEEVRIFGGVMERCYAYHDMLLARLLKLAGPDTTVIILSDHGFHNGPLRPRVFYDNDGKKKIGPGANPVAWHRPMGVLAACGPGIKKGQEIHGTNLLDICPTILTLLGLPVGDDMDGRPLLHMMEDQTPPAHVPTHEGEHPNDGVHRGEIVDDPYAANEVLKQLAELGYIEAPTGDNEQMVKVVLHDRKSSLAQVYEASGRHDLALPLLRELLEAEPNNDRRSRLVASLITQGKHAEAEEHLKDAPDDPAMSPIAASLRSHLLFAKGKYKEAGEILEKLKGLGVRLPMLDLQIGKVKMRLGDIDGAADAFQDALEKDGDDAEAHDNMGVALRCLGKHEDAVFHHMKSITLMHNRPDTHVHLGMALSACRKFDWAIQAFKTAAELAPTSPFPHRCLYKLYREVLRDDARADEHLKIAMKLRGEVGDRERDAFLAKESWD